MNNRNSIYYGLNGTQPVKTTKFKPSVDYGGILGKPGKGVVIHNIKNSEKGK